MPPSRGGLMMAQPVKKRGGWGGGEGGDGEENKSRAGAQSPGNVRVTQHIVILTDASLKAQITGLRSGHLAVSTELLLSINAYYKHTHTARDSDSCTYSVPGSERTREMCQLPPADELCMGTTGDGKAERRIRNNSRAISGSEREGQKWGSVTAKLRVLRESRGSKQDRDKRGKKHKRKLTEERLFQREKPHPRSRSTFLVNCLPVAMTDPPISPLTDLHFSAQTPVEKPCMIN